MKYLLTLSLVFSLSGCFYQKVDMSDIIAAEDFCKELNSEVLYITAHMTGDEIVTCVNSKTQTLHLEK